MRITATFNKEIYKTEKDGVIVGLYNVKETDSCEIIIGKMLPTDKGVVYSFDGEYVNHSKYGKQFKAEYFEQNVSTEENIVKFLASPLIKGIGLKTAEKIVKTYGEKTLEMMDKDITCLLKVKGFPKKKFEQVKECYTKERSVKEVIEKLGKWGISVQLAIRAQRRFENDTMKIIRFKPYRLCEVEGISFEVADRIGRTLPDYENDFGRFRACARYVLKANENNQFQSIIGERTSGSNGMEKNDFGKVMLSLLYINSLTGKDICNNTIKMIRNGDLFVCTIDDKQYIFPTGLAKIEKATAEKIISLINEKNSFNMKYAEEICAKHNELDIKQIDAIKNAFMHNISLIIGVPGSGKTTTIKTIAEIYKKAYPNNEMYFLAPSGKAAARIKEGMFDDEHVHISTIHSGIEIQTDIIEDVYDESEEEIHFENALIVVDEISMLDTRVAYRLFSAVGKNCRIVLSGDDNQLQSVQSGAVLSDLIESEAIHTTVLTKIFRQSKESSIYQNLFKIREGNTDLTYGKDFCFHEESDILKIEDEMIKLYKEKVAEYGFDNVMLIVPFSRHEAGVRNLNLRIQNLFTNSSDFEMRGTYPYRKNDLVMQLKNDYTNHIMNGEIGQVVSYSETDGNKEITVKFDNGYKTYDKENIEELALAYAYTIHKAQGSESKCVITCCHKMHGRMLKRNVFYTAIAGNQFDDIEDYLTYLSQKGGYRWEDTEQFGNLTYWGYVIINFDITVDRAYCEDCGHFVGNDDVCEENHHHVVKKPYLHYNGAGGGGRNMWQEQNYVIPGKYLDNPDLPFKEGDVAIIDNILDMDDLYTTGLLFVN